MIELTVTDCDIRNHICSLCASLDLQDICIIQCSVRIQLLRPVRVEAQRDLSNKDLLTSSGGE